MLQTRPRFAQARRPMALTIAVLTLLPMFAIPANAQLFHRKPVVPGATKPGMSTGKKVALVAGAALLYYLYKRHMAAEQAQQAQTASTPTMGTPTTASTGHAQLYRSKNGGIYYRDAQGKPVWLTVPNQPVQVSTADLQRYAPDYARYSGPAPAAPSGYRTQPFSDFEPSTAPGPGMR